jgi:hypothetical protein
LIQPVEGAVPLEIILMVMEMTADPVAEVEVLHLELQAAQAIHRVDLLLKETMAEAQIIHTQLTRPVAAEVMAQSVQLWGVVMEQQIQ